MAVDVPATDAERMAALLAERDAIARELPVGFYTGWLDPTGPSFTFDYISDRVGELLGVPVDALRADWSSMLDHVHEDDVAALEVEVYTTEPRPIHWTGRLIVDGVERWLDLQGREASNRPRWWIGVISDVTDRKELEIALQRTAMTDVLTGLGNRRHFADRAEYELRRLVRTGAPLSLMVIDVDHFKALNDTYGHQAGDRALQGLSRVIGRVVRSTDVAARLGGDEFALLLPDTDAAAAEILARRLAEGLRVDQERSAEMHLLSLSIGIATCRARSHTEPAPSLDVLLSQADSALYAAKREGRNRVRTYVPEGGAG